MLGHRAKLSVHLIAQAKPKEPTAEEKKTQAIAQFATIPTTENITPDIKTLESRINAVPIAENTAKAIAIAFSDHLGKGLKLGKALLDKILNEADAALGLADMGKVAKPEILKNSNVENIVGVGSRTTPVIITDVHAWKAGLQMSAGVRPVRDLADFIDDIAQP